MVASLRELRQRRQSVTSTQKITRAMELIASSRIVKSQRAAAQALPYTHALNRAVAAVAAHSRHGAPHPLLADAGDVKRVAVFFITSDRGMNGAYSSNAIRAATQMTQRILDEGQEPVRYVMGRKGITYLKFRGIPAEASWEGFSDAPTYDRAVEISDRLVADFLKPADEGGVDEIWAIYTRMRSMISQVVHVRRILPLEVVEGSEDTSGDGPIPLYEFEPDPETVLDSLLPLYVRSRIWFYLLQSAASQLASQQRAMKSATDNADQLIDRLTREANQARQAEITQEINEIVSGANALTQ